MSNAITWFEIPTTDLDRAVRFYETLLGGRALKREIFGGAPIAIFEAGSRSLVAGALVCDPKRQPASDGSLVYLNAGKDLDGCLSRVEKAGGRVVLPKTDIGDPGFIALVRDTEGNVVGLHAEKQ